MPRAQVMYTVSRSFEVTESLYCKPWDILKDIHFLRHGSINKTCAMIWSLCSGRLALKFLMGARCCELKA